jgi:hypothetical protein
MHRNTAVTGFRTRVAERTAFGLMLLTTTAAAGCGNLMFHLVFTFFYGCFLWAAKKKKRQGVSTVHSGFKEGGCSLLYAPVCF